MKYTELVIQDHIVLLRGLDILEGMLTKLENGERIEIADVRAILKLIQVHQLVMKHDESRALVIGATDALASRRVGDFVYSSRRLCTVLRSHMDLEDGVLDDLARQSIPEIDVNLSRLEQKYAAA
jgi:hemerythrin-like domain-containing protein